MRIKNGFTPLEKATDFNSVRKNFSNGASERSSLMGFILIFLIAACLFAWGTVGGEEAPDFTLADLDGNPFNLSNLKGKVVILDFWATWCPPCRAEIPHFQSLYQEYKEKGLEVVGIALDQGGAKAIRPFVEENKITYPILVGDQKVVEDYGGIRGIPTTFVIDRKGDIVEKFVGYQDKEIFEKVIGDLL